MSEAQLQKILEGEDQRPVAEFFQGMSEKRRRDFAPMSLKWFQKVSRNEFFETETVTIYRFAHLPVAATAVFATATMSEIKQLGRDTRRVDDVIIDVLLDRRPPWITELVTHLLDDPRPWNHWSGIRHLIAKGLTESPDDPRYVLAMFKGIDPMRGWAGDPRTVENGLRDDPALLDDEVWRLFDYDGDRENSLALCERSDGGGWSDAFLALVKSGELPRDRLLSRSLDALDRDFNHYRAKWFATFHDALKPSADEQRAFGDRYLQLLGVSAPNIVSWAFKKVEAINKAGGLDAAALIAGLAPVLEARQKGIVKKALKLMAKTAKQSPALASDVAEAAVVVLAHEEADVQDAALDVIDKYGDPADRDFIARLAEHADVVAPSQRKRLDKWLADSGETASTTAEDEQPSTFDRKQLKGLDATLLDLFGVNALIDNLESGRAEFPAATFDGTDIPRLRDDRRITPIAEFDELIEVCARIVEDDSDADEVERALDGMSRLCDQKPDDFEQRVGPLLKRVTHKLKKDAAPFIGVGADNDMCGLVYAWCTGDVLEGRNAKRGSHKVIEFDIQPDEACHHSENMKKAIGFLSRRVLEVARRAAAGKAAPLLLSAPTHVGGWIDPLRFVERINAIAGENPDVADVSLALLRLAPEGRGDALKQMKKVATEWGRAVRYGLGAKGIKVGKTPALWIAAARCRSPWADDENVEKAFPDLGPDAGRAAVCTAAFPTSSYNHTRITIKSEPPIPKTPDLQCVTVTLHAQRKVGEGLTWELGGFGGKTVGTVRWTATVWPQARESFFAGAAYDIGDNLDWHEARWQNKTLLEPLLDSGTPLKEMGLLLLCAGLAAKDPGEHGLATDAAIQAIEDGRLGSDNLGEMLARLLPTGLIKPARWQQRLADVARISDVHAAVIQQALQHCFRPARSEPPRDFAKLLDLLKELSIDLGQAIAHEPCRKFLAGLKGSGKAAKTAKTLLALETSDPNRMGGILESALSQRLTDIRNLSDRVSQ